MVSYRYLVVIAIFLFLQMKCLMGWTEILSVSKRLEVFRVMDYPKEEYIGFIKRTINVSGSYGVSSVYNSIFNCLVKADESCEGPVSQTKFSKLERFWRVDRLPMPMDRGASRLSAAPEGAVQGSRSSRGADAT